MAINVSRGTHGEGCGREWRCECGAPVTHRPVVWEQCEPVEWERAFDLGKARAQVAGEVRELLASGRTLDEALDLLSSRIPAYDPESPTGMRDWFTAMADLGLLFHPEDPPHEVINLASGAPIRIFTAAEATQAAAAIAAMTEQHGHEAMLSACYPVFMGREEDQDEDA